MDSFITYEDFKIMEASKKEKEKELNKFILAGRSGNLNNLYNVMLEYIFEK